MVSVVFPAAGQAHRMQVGLNKVFLTLAGKPMLLRTLLTFSKVPDVGELIVAVGADEVEPVTSLLGRVKGLAPWRVLEGGTERQYSIRNGLALVSEEAPRRTRSRSPRRTAPSPRRRRAAPFGRCRHHRDSARTS